MSAAMKPLMIFVCLWLVLMPFLIPQSHILADDTLDSWNRYLTSHRSHLHKLWHRHQSEIYREHYPDIYWINLDKSTRRRQYMEKQLMDLNIKNQSLRIEAITPNSTQFILHKLVKPCRRNTDRDIAVILSHLTAIHASIYKPIKVSNISLIHQDPRLHLSNYALILEDDVRWEYHINFTDLIHHIPNDLNILQLMTSNPDAIVQLWGKYNSSNANSTALWTRTDWRDTSKGGKHALYWSCQAYLIYKPGIKDFIDDVINMHPITHQVLSFKIINSFFPKGCKRTRSHPCVLANCLFSDTYIYAGGAPTYVSHIPFFNGGRIGYESEIHQNQVPVHKTAFSMIHRLTGVLKHQNVSMHQNHTPIGRSMDGIDHGILSWSVDKRLPSFLIPYKWNHSAV